MAISAEGFNITNIIYFTPAFFATLFILKKHGLKHEIGWYFLTLLCLICISGAILGLAAASNPDSTEFAVSLILNTTGSILLVVLFTNIVNYIEKSSEHPIISPERRRWINLIGLTAFVLSIVAGSMIYSSNADTRADGQTYNQVSYVLILVQCVILVALLLASVGHLHSNEDIDMNHLWCVGFSIPFVMVRVVYSVVAAFMTSSQVFDLGSSSTGHIAARTICMVAMEIIAVTLYIVGGILMKRSVGQHQGSEEMMHEEEVMAFNQPQAK